MRSEIDLDNPSLRSRIIERFYDSFAKKSFTIKVKEPKQKIVDEVKSTFRSELVRISHPSKDEIKDSSVRDKHIDGNLLKFVIRNNLSRMQIKNRLDIEIKYFVDVSSGVLEF